MTCKATECTPSQRVFKSKVTLWLRVSAMLIITPLVRRLRPSKLACVRATLVLLANNLRRVSMSAIQRAWRSHRLLVKHDSETDLIERLAIVCDGFERVS